MIPIQKLKLQIPNIFVYKCLETGLKFDFLVPELSPIESVVKRTAFSRNSNKSLYFWFMYIEIFLLFLGIKKI